MPASANAADHPTHEQLNGFVLGRLDPSGTRFVVGHLAGCEACREAIAPLARFLTGPERAARHASGSSGSQYEILVGRFAAALRCELKKLRPAQPLPTVDELLAQIFCTTRLLGEEAWAECEALLAESWALRYDDPQEMLALATMAVALSQVIDPGIRGPQVLADLQVRALAAVGNARRVANEPHAAERDLRRALERFDQGTGDRLLLARLMSFTASVFQDQRRFGEAEALLSLAFSVYEETGEKHLAGSTLWKKGIVVGYAGDSRRALRLVEMALTRLDATVEPGAALHALHSLIWFLVECGRLQEASDVAWSARGLYAERGGDILDIKVVWLNGRIAAGLGHPGRAEICFREARGAFLDHHLPYDAAVVALDLAVLLLEGGRAAEARALVEETVNTFSILRIPRETSAALILLSAAVQQDRLTITVLRTAAAELQRVQG